MSTEPQSAPVHPSHGRSRVVIENVAPRVDGGRFPVKRCVGDEVAVEADVFTDGHDVLGCLLLVRRRGSSEWTERPMEPLVNDRWRGTFRADELGVYEYTVRGWIDDYGSWRRDLERRPDGDPDLDTAFRVGAALIDAAAARADGFEEEHLRAAAATLRGVGDSDAKRTLARSETVAELVARHADRGLATTFEPPVEMRVDPVLARFSSWYELFPRSAAGGERHGTLADVAKQLPDVAAMGFDVVYLPPIHPIGRAHRKGKNNTLSAGPDDVGSPWAIGAREGGHKAIHPQLGSEEDFERLVQEARRNGLEIALDVAFQCAPDHPYVTEHPEWFRHRPDGSIQYAENPPKKYQDIYPFDFECEDWRALWNELLDVVLHWTERGVRVFRVDNPHTKPFPFWEWLIGEVKARHPETIFLSEAFTRPKVMARLAKLGFSQSYTYFTWRNTKPELTAYFTELTRTELAEFFRPNAWPNTPDILPEFLQIGGRPAFVIRLVLAGTLAASYGVYGPAYELCDNRPLKAGGEEYLDSEKYQLRSWDLDQPGNLRGMMTRINAIRRENPALQSDVGLRFHPVDNEQIIAYSKSTPRGDDVVLAVVNLDPHHKQSGWLELPIEELGVGETQSYQMHDLLGGARYLWTGRRNYVEIDPQSPAHVFRMRRRVRTEQDFDYYL